MKQRILDGALGFFLASTILLGFWLWMQSFKQTEYLFYQHIETEEFKEELRLNAEREAYKAIENMKALGIIE